MKEETTYVKRSQSDHTLTFKLNLVRETESGEISTIYLNTALVLFKNIRMGVGNSFI